MSTAAVVTALPDPAPGTVRRTLSLEISPDPGWREGLRVTALGRDLLIGAGVLATAAMSVTIDAATRVTGLESALPAPLTGPLIGTAAVHGFRARLAAIDGLDPSCLESAILDELPTVRLIAGYAAMIEQISLSESNGPSVPLIRPGERSPMVGVCGGWAAGATADTRVRAGLPVLRGTPPAPALASMTSYFHPEPAPRRATMRRRRILDVTPDRGGYQVFEYYRDSHFDTELREGALHEYEVRARASAGEDGTLADGTLADIAVTPHALPFTECPLAAPNAADLTGTRLAEITGTVRARLTGTRSCTHLNDTLRFLRYVPALAAGTHETGQ